MPVAPRSHQPRHYQTSRERYRAQDRRRLTAQERGYTQRWTDYSERLCRERVFCELCLTVGIETTIVRTPERLRIEGQRQKPISVTDHIIPVTGKDDPLFWEPANHWVLCVDCHNWKTVNFDGGWGSKVVPVADRSTGGIAARRAAVVGRNADASVAK